MANANEMGYEALSSAFYNMPFSQWLGERKDPYNGNIITNWFVLRESPHAPAVRVSVTPTLVDLDVIRVRAEWYNDSGPERLKAEQTFHIPVYDEGQIRLATEDVVVKVLNIYADVIGGVGVAGPISKLAPETEETDPEKDMAVDAEEFEG